MKSALGAVRYLNFFSWKRVLPWFFSMAISDEQTVSVQQLTSDGLPVRLRKVRLLAEHLLARQLSSGARPELRCELEVEGRNKKARLASFYRRDSAISGWAWRMGMPKLDPVNSLSTAKFTPTTFPRKLNTGPPLPPEVVWAS